MKKPAKIVALILCVLMAGVMFIACGEKDNSTESEKKDDVNPEYIVGEDTEQSDQPADGGLVLDNLPELDFEGYDYRILYCEYGLSTPKCVFLYPEAEEGEVLNDAIYRRNQKIQERLNVNFKATTTATYDSMNILAKNVQADDDAYDTYMVVDREAHSLAEKGLLYPFNDVPYIDLSKPYWMPEINRVISVGNKLPYAYSDEMLSVFEHTIVLYFNKKTVADLELEDFYGLVSTGEWTFDKFFENARAAIKNVSGSDKMSSTDDYWGIVADYGLICSYWINAGIITVEKDENDMPYFNLPGNERFFAVMEKVFDYNAADGIYLDTESNKMPAGIGPEAGFDFFRNGHALFALGTIQEMITLRDMPDDFGVIPFPKYDSAQERYYTRLLGGRPFVIPGTNQRPDAAGAVMEAMACETRNTVFPAYYESSLKNKFSRDPESVEMLDLIREAAVWDLFIIWGQQIGSPLANIFKSGNNTYASWIEKNEENIGRLIQKSVDAILDKY